MEDQRSKHAIYASILILLATHKKTKQSHLKALKNNRFTNFKNFFISYISKISVIMPQNCKQGYPIQVSLSSISMIQVPQNSGSGMNTSSKYYNIVA